VTAVNANATTASSKPQTSRFKRHVSFIGEFLSVSGGKEVPPQRTHGRVEEHSLKISKTLQRTLRFQSEN